MEFSTEQKKTVIIAAAAAAGVGQTIILRKMMDTTQPSLMPQLGTFGKPSSIIGIVGGASAIILSIFVLKDNQYANALTAYGGSALVSGLLSGAEIL